jgi:predicted LPLAT superfamily acyltransferase
MSRHWAAIGEAGALTGLRFMVWVNNHLGRVAFNILLIPVMAYFIVRRGEARRASVNYLRRARRQCPGQLGAGPLLWLSFRHFFAFGQALLDRYVAWMQPPSNIDMSPEVRKMHSSLVDSGKGILLIGSHFGNLEYSRSLTIHRGDLVVNILLHDLHAAKFATLMRTSAAHSRMNLIPVTELDLDLALRLKEKVANGEWLLIAGDRVPIDSSDKVCAATFFGDQADFPIGPYVLANLLRCPVYLLHCFRKQGHYHLDMELFEKVILPSRQNKRRNYDSEVQKFATALEKQVRQEPLQWFNFYDFWDEENTSELQADRLRHDDQE